MQNVHYLGAARTGRYTPTGHASADRQQVMQAVREELYGVDREELERIGFLIGCSMSTLYAIRSGRTLWPRYTTLLPLLRVLHLELIVQRRTK